MPKKPNPEIRDRLDELATELSIEAGFIRDTQKQLDDIGAWLNNRAAMIKEIVDDIRAEIDELHNAPVKKPRAKPVPSGITRAVVIAVKARAFSGEANSDIAAHYGFNQGRVSDILNGKYDHAR